MAGWGDPTQAGIPPVCNLDVDLDTLRSLHACVCTVAEVRGIGSTGCRELFAVTGVELVTRYSRSTLRSNN